MVFVGLVGMLDPPRPEVKDSIAKCNQAGIRVIMITGDNKKTAESICKKIGIFTPNEDLTDRSYTGREFDEMSKEQQIAAVHRANLFSRTEPTHKQQLVDLLKQEGFIVAMVCLLFFSGSRSDVLDGWRCQWCSCLEESGYRYCYGYWHGCCQACLGHGSCRW